jgi:hypothetical protein
LFKGFRSHDPGVLFFILNVYHLTRHATCSISWPSIFIIHPNPIGIPCISWVLTLFWFVQTLVLVPCLRFMSLQVYHFMDNILSLEVLNMVFECFNWTNWGFLHTYNSFHKWA